MIHSYGDLKKGFRHEYDVLVIGSGAGGAVAAHNFALAGHKTAILEAGPRLTPADMTRDAPNFLARYFWEGGLRMLGGSAMFPAMQGRMVGGSTVSNSAIMFRLPDYVADEWAREAGLDFIKGPAMASAYDRIFKQTHTVRTPSGALGKRNGVVREALAAAGLKGAPLPRAVKNCGGCNDCLTGCFDGRKQSADLVYLNPLVNGGKKGGNLEIFPNCHVTKVLTKGTRAIGAIGWVTEPPNGRRRAGKFQIFAKTVIMAAGATHTPVILQKSNITAGGHVGRTFYAHIGGAAVGFMEDPIDPWVGATQGWGAFSPDIPGLKYESLWAPESVLMVKWGGLGPDYLERLADLRNAVCIAALYRAKVTGRVRTGWNGMPSIKLFIPHNEIGVTMRGVKTAVDGLLQVGAKYVYTAINGVPPEIRTKEDSALLLNPAITATDASMTVNHLFGSCPMGADPNRSAVDLHGAVHGVEGLYICDASLFPSPSAVNPQATVMALSDLISRRLAGFAKSEYVKSKPGTKKKTIPKKTPAAAAGTRRLKS